jgi:uncharacterized protein
MSYNHGITMVEKPTTLQQPIESLSSVQVVFGTAPVNLASDPSAVVNKPVVIRSFEEAKLTLGYSDNWKNYTLCQSMDASFKELKIAPVIFVNVLDPAVHKTTQADADFDVVNKEIKVEQEGILLNTLVVKSSDGVTTYVKDTDYIADFDNEGKVTISILGTNITDTTVKVGFDKLDPSAVTNADIIGGYDSTTDTYKGIELVTTVYPSLGIVPGLLLAPGWSHNAEVGAVLIAKTASINGSFDASNLLDVTGKTKEESLTAKKDAGYDDKSSLVCWPKAKIGKKVYYHSAIVAATMARTNAESGDVPYKSPSNKKIPVSAMVNDDGKEIFLDQVQGNVLNAKGIVTAINMNGWRVWGNNTAAYDADIYTNGKVMDPKDRFIAVRRMFDWWGNTFIQAYFDKVDDPVNDRLIESVVDSENIRANGFQARGQIAGARIEYRKSDNPINQVLGGKIKFIQKIAFFTPAEEIVNELEFDPTILEEYFGGE